MRVTPIVGEVETAALEHQPGTLRHATLRHGATGRADELGLFVGDFSEEVLEIVPVGASIVVSGH